MLRFLAATTAAVLVGVGTAAVPPQAAGAPADYLPIRVFDATDAISDVGEGDLARAAIQLDATIGQATFFANVTDSSHDDAIVLGLGTPDAGGTCQAALEIVGGTKTTSWIVRNPGETTLPPQTTDYRPRLVVDPRLVGFQPSCSVIRTVNAAGTTLDTISDSSVQLVPVGERDLTLFADPNVLQEKAGHSFALHFAVPDPYLDYAPSQQWLLNPLYGLDIAITPGPGVTLDIAHITTTPGPSPYEPLDVAHATVDSPGWHYVDVDATAGNGAPWHGRVYLWNVGGEPPPATGDLTGLGFWGHYFTADAEGDLAARNAQLWFVNKRFATTNPLQGGLPRCRAASSTCLRYSYQKSTGILQIKKWRGVLTDDMLRWHPRLSSADDAFTVEMGPWFFDGVYPHRMLRQWSGHRIPAGSYRFVLKQDKDTWQQYTFGAHHTYTFRYGWPGSDVVRGSYRIARDRITFTPRHGKVRTEVLAVAVSPHGKPRPGTGLLIRNGWFVPVS